jgi:xanthine dehydrogenase accessory factor
MDDRFDIWDAARTLAESGVTGTLASVSRQRGSCPMASDAKMLVAEDGKRWGTVGGGCIESDVVAASMAVAESGEPRFVTHTLTADSAGDLGLSCGGTAEFFLEPVVRLPEMIHLYSSVATAIRERRPVVVFTAADWAAGPKKAVWFVEGESQSEGQSGKAAKGQGGAKLLTVGEFELTAALEQMAGCSRSTFFDEDAGILVESVPRKPRVVIFGAGHVGVEIAKVAAGVDFHVLVYDDREEFANAERIPWAHEVKVVDFRTVFDGLKFDADDFLLATSRGHNFDALIIQHAAVSSAGYVGMLGSKRKRAVMFRALEAAGIPEEALARVSTPVGLDIGADTPAEIAISVVAELVKVRRMGGDA